MSIAGVGFSDGSDSFAGAVEAAREALERSGIDRPDLAIFFTTAKHDPAQVLRGLRSVVGPDGQIMGGQTVGVITNDRLGYEGSQLGVAILQSDTIHVGAYAESGLPDREHAVGLALGKRIKDAGVEGDPNLLLFYEKVKELTPDGPVMNHAMPFLNGVSEALGGWPPAAGSLLLGDMQWRPGVQCLGDQILEQSALALTLTGPVRMDSTIMHALRPMSRYVAITKSDGPAVLEIEGRPALEVVQEMFGDDDSWKEYPFFIVLGVNRGEKFGDYREEDYVNLVCVAVDTEQGALVMSESTLREGTEVQFMRRRIDFDDMRKRVGNLLERIQGRRPVLAVYIDCIGRSSVFTSTEGEEATVVQEALGEIPMIGTYSGGELAIVAGEMYPMNYTAILNIFTEDADGSGRP